MGDGWLRVWLQGGAVENWDYFTRVEPPDVIHVIRSPTGLSWLCVFADWRGALAYRREHAVEQFDDERIFYPL
jgi:hypothetical protein